MTITMIHTVSVITVSLKVVYTAGFVKIAMMNISQNFGPEKIIKYAIRNIYSNHIYISMDNYIW